MKEKKVKARSRIRKVISIGLLTTIAIAAFTLTSTRSDIVAPLFVSQRTCGPVQATIQIQTEDATGFKRIKKVSIPIAEKDNDIHADYQDAVASHALAAISSTVTTDPANSDHPFRLEVLFAPDRHTVNSGGAYDMAFGRVKLASPWVRVIENDWNPCRMQVIFFHQWRQIIRDQFELSQGKKLHWPGPKQYSTDEFREYRYAFRKSAYGAVVTPGLSTIPTDALLQFYNSDYPILTTIDGSGPSMPDYSVQKNTLDGYIRLTNRLIDSSIKEKQAVSISGIMDIEGAKNYYFYDKFVGRFNSKHQTRMFPVRDRETD